MGCILLYLFPETQNLIVYTATRLLAFCQGLKGNINSFLIINLWGFAQLLPSMGVCQVLCILLFCPISLSVQSLRRAYGKGDAFRIALSSFNDFYNVSVLRQDSSA
ncbi:uncharacterized protein LOC114319256 [Camellia sinensis]|uniref:uncharacterized protein LOC114319256 n=1 Tax=Camellia sinensis TaxID=4442 RepID=UPI001036AC6D|nr:uncharacterized protein LOC114319256 [Camellia sinensis]